MLKKAAGFGLIEVLIASVILAVGLVGLASLQAKAIRVMQEGDNMVMASMIAQECAKRMLVNPYVTKLGIGGGGYLYDDMTGYGLTPAGNYATVSAWAANFVNNFPNMFRCYPNGGSITTANSCFLSGENINDGSLHFNAIMRSGAMDQYEMRLWADASLPNGRIKLCFDSTTAYTSFSCDNSLAGHIANRLANVFTVKVQWTNIFTNSSQMYALQFTAQCDASGNCY